MYIEPPRWFLTAHCPACEEGELEFSTCPTCGLVVLICNELNDVVGISGQKCGPVLSYGCQQTCQNCRISTYYDFRRSSSEEIRALGFRYPDDYR
ncbi:hypothetical protein [Mycolicibacterium vinylchloridicum]|uniref:hypothetical protein n=1 Tax=Mycolicibacterium vinylchloridicum TaxID=2736928 RepID=UPI0015CC8BE6|nr:hypothetical protein [Mycolicibacterium vinylchloridicum]